MRRLPLLGGVVTLGIVVVLGFLIFLTWRWGQSSGPPQQALPAGPVPESTGGTPGSGAHRPPAGGTATTTPGTAGADAGAHRGSAGPRTGGQTGSGTGGTGASGEPNGSGSGPGGAGSEEPDPGGVSPPMTPPPTTPPTADPPTQQPTQGGGAPAPQVEEARTVELRSADDERKSVDIDYWQARHQGDGDLNATADGLAGAGGAKIALVRQGRGDWETCSADRDDWTSEVPYSALTQGTYLCARSSEGRVAYLRIEAVPTEAYPAITFYGSTWDHPN
ncbi:hypothetical protein QLQ12_19615 [Actinoplanes sp. NEAU-A12]|uniref:Serine/threonine protein kinase n=1 Tax=Actinoplanes sandaracinus TaxID=3045177 RepID=A0ABT6WM56_9ACTN|nr:hypothetical protein [Actinoplanes sandaracinus]MDI6100823.1 hypothetical protein [Actinoplanes sandaracinus]